MPGRPWQWRLGGQCPHLAFALFTPYYGEHAAWTYVHTYKNHCRTSGDSADPDSSAHAHTHTSLPGPVSNSVSSYIAVIIAKSVTWCNQYVDLHEAHEYIISHTGSKWHTNRILRLLVSYIRDCGILYWTHTHTHIFLTNHTLQFKLKYIIEEVGRNESIGSFLFVVSNMNILPDLQFSF